MGTKHAWPVRKDEDELKERAPKGPSSAFSPASLLVAHWLTTPQAPLEGGREENTHAGRADEVQLEKESQPQEPNVGEAALVSQRGPLGSLAHWVLEEQPLWQVLVAASQRLPAGQSVLARQRTQAPLLQRGPFALVAHCASLAQGSHARVVGLQKGLDAVVHWLLSMQRTQRPLLLLQNAPSGWLAQSALLAHALHALSVQTGLLPATRHALLSRHSTHRAEVLWQ